MSASGAGPAWGAPAAMAPLLFCLADRVFTEMGLFKDRDAGNKLYTI
jgi:hypothetical protein